LIVAGPNGKVSPVFNFEKLETWPNAIGFAGQVCALAGSFPADEHFGRNLTLSHQFP
jgi:hypothetical protein